MTHTAPGFSLMFSDADRDGLVSLNEVTALSVVPVGNAGIEALDMLITVPNIPGIADGIGGTWVLERFADHGQGSFSSGPPFAYNLAPLASVPVPAAPWFLGSALGGIGIMRRRVSS